MSTATAPPVLAPKHSSRKGDEDRPLTLPSAESAGDVASSSSTSTTTQSATAAVSRTLAGMLAFMFKRPIRLFRPVKISTWAGLQAIAEEQGRAVTPSFVRGLIRKEGWRFLPRHILPPMLVNTSIGLTLFTAYTTSETLLLPYFTSTSSHLLLIPFISGAFAGAAQALLSAPLDNARLLLLRRQRFLRLHKTANTSTPRGARRTRGLNAASSAAAGGTPFVSWLALLRDSVFQSSRNAMGGAAAATPRERMEQGRRWARRGWSLMNLSVAKDSIGFGVFFLIFEVGREGSRNAALRYDGIDPDAEGKQRRSASGLILQSIGILVSGGLAGWVFGLVARPFERARVAIWEGRSRWAERDGRLKVIEELALAGTDPVLHHDSHYTAKRRRRGLSAGGASERHANEVLGPTGRKEFKVRIGRIRTVTRSAFLVKRRKARQKEQKRLLALRARQAHSPTSPVPSPSSFPSPPLRQPMPSATSLVRAACGRFGTANYLFAPRSVLQLMEAHKLSPNAVRTLTSSTTTTKVRVGPTRLSARGKQAAQAVSKASSGKGWRRGLVVLSYVPPYTVGLLFYALTAGDLKIEV